MSRASRIDWIFTAATRGQRGFILFCTGLLHSELKRRSRTSVGHLLVCGHGICGVHH